MWCFCKALQLCKGNRTRMGLDLRGQCWDWAAEVFKTQCAFRSSWSTKLVWHWASKRFVLAYESDNEQRLVLIFTKTCLCCCLWRAFPKVLFFSLAAPKTFLPVTQMLSFCFMLSCYEADALVFCSYQLCVPLMKQHPIKTAVGVLQNGGRTQQFCGSGTDDCDALPLASACFVHVGAAEDRSSCENSFVFALRQESVTTTEVLHQRELTVLLHVSSWQIMWMRE